MSCSGCASGAKGKAGGCSGGGGCNKLEVHDWLAGVPLPGGHSPFDAVEVRFKNTRKGFYRNAGGLSLMIGDTVTVEASSGHDVGVVSLVGELVRAQMRRKGAGTDTYELRKVLRKSTQADIDMWQQACKREDEVLFGTRRICADARLDMKVSDVEFQGDGKRATIYYTAEQRVDFRDLLRKLSDRFQVRVDMKQIGARQEAARLGGIGPCGRELCCSTWLTDFRTVSTSAARYQQLALNPQKLTGLCGKLKCCLNYELDMYIEAVKSFPSPNAKLKTKSGTGTHIKTDIFKERMWYVFKKPGEPVTMAGFPVETVREILARNKEGIEPEVDLHMADEPDTAGAMDETTDYGNVIDGAEDLSRFDKKIKTGGKLRDRDRKKRKVEPGAGGRPQRQPERKAQAGGTEGAAGAGQGGARRNRDARGRKRRGPRPQGPGPQSGTKPDNA